MLKTSLCLKSSALLKDTAKRMLGKKTVLLKGTASEPVLSAVEGCRNRRNCTSALAAEVRFCRDTDPLFG